MLNVARAIDRFAVSVQRERAGAGSYSTSADETYGDFTPGAAATATIDAAIQPISGAQKRELPEGLRADAEWMVWSRSELLEDDVVIHKTKRYELNFVWPRDEGGFWRAAARLTK